MSSKSSKDLSDKAIKIVVDRVDSLVQQHHSLARDTAKGLRLTAKLAEQQDLEWSKRIERQNRTITVLAIALAVQALYLIIML